MKVLNYVLGVVLLVLVCSSCGFHVKHRGEKGDSGAPGAPGAPGNDGSNGNNGADGSNGADGTNGHNALLESSASGTCINGGTTIITATDLNDSGLIDSGDSNLRSFDICNGAVGAQGAVGASAPPTPYSPVGIVDPCGDTASVFDEVFLRLSNGTLLASFSDNAAGLNTRWSVLTPGSFITTDGTNCHFTVDSAGNVTW